MVPAPCTVPLLFALLPPILCCTHPCCAAWRTHPFLCNTRLLQLRCMSASPTQHGGGGGGNKTLHGLGLHVAC